MANPQIQNDPIYSLPYLYISGLNISTASAANGPILAIAPGQARDNTDNIDMPIGFPDLQGNITVAPFYINNAVLGYGGLDFLPMIASSYYAIYEIGDSRYYNPVGAIATQINNIAPIMPLGYDSLRLLGFVSTSTSPALFTTTFIINMLNSQSYYFNPAVSVLSGGNATTFTTINLTPPIPATGVTLAIVYINVTFTPAAVGDYVQFRPFNQTVAAGSNNLPKVIGVAAGVPQQATLQVVAINNAGVMKIDYLVSSASDSVNVAVAGYTLART